VRPRALHIIVSKATTTRIDFQTAGVNVFMAALFEGFRPNDT
jgi:hypothetical protein